MDIFDHLKEICNVRHYLLFHLSFLLRFLIHPPVYLKHVLIDSDGLWLVCRSFSCYALQWMSSYVTALMDCRRNLRDSRFILAKWRDRPKTVDGLPICYYILQSSTCNEKRETRKTTFTFVTFISDVNFTASYHFVWRIQSHTSI